MLEKRENFTQGPWVAVQGQEDKQNKVYVERETSYAGRKYKKQFLIATLPSHHGCMYVEDLANLALVAAAPEMYGMLQELHSYFCQDPDIWSRIHDLLAKARGASQEEKEEK